MRFLAILFVVLLVSCVESSPDKGEGESDSQDTIQVHVETDMAGFDAERAEKLGADDYGMKTYVMAFLVSGPNRPEDPDLRDSLQMAHMENIGRLADEGKLVLAGPFDSKDSLRGIYLFDTDSVELAQAWTESDPAIQYGSLKMILKKWYGSAALLEVNATHNKISKIKF